MNGVRQKLTCLLTINIVGAFTEKCVTDVLGYLISRVSGPGEIMKFAIEQTLELQHRPYKKLS